MLIAWKIFFCIGPSSPHCIERKKKNMRKDEHILKSRTLVIFVPKMLEDVEPSNKCKLIGQLHVPSLRVAGQ